MTMLPRHVMHADWSVSPKKRWAAAAERDSRDRYLVGAPVQMTPEKILDAAARPSTLMGFDFPIGIPAQYADRANVGSFARLLLLLRSDPWKATFFDVARVRSEIAVRRPFYPHAPGGK